MAVMSVDELYAKYIKHLPSTERLRLVEITAHDLAQPREQSVVPPKRSIMELHGLGAEIWKGIDAKEYINELRDEWDSRA